VPRLTREEIVAFFAKNYLFGSLSVSDINELMPYARVVHYPSGKEIFAKGAPGSSLMAVIEGIVRISSPSLAGREITLNLIHPGEVFGEIALLDGLERTADAIAMTDCELLVLSRREFMPFLERRPDICIKIIEILCHRLRNTSEQVEELSFWHLENRLAKALIRLAEESEGENSSVLPPNFSITQRQLANMVGGSREHVNRQLQSWRKAGFIEIGKGAISIRDRDAITRFL
jgi:CRP/FNR family transcriptional regulator, cyclic AMP receptor protein